MRISLIAAVARNGVIGRGGGLPWHLPADLRRFKELTLGHHLVVGRKTYESIGRPLPGRVMVVLTRRAGWSAPGVTAARSLDGALEVAAAAGEEEVFVAGGGEIYRQALPRADRLYLTEIDAEMAGDTRFPVFDPASWKRVFQQEHAPDEKNPHPYRFLVYERRGGGRADGGEP